MSDRSVQLMAHPGHPIDGVDRLEFSARWIGDGLIMQYDLFGDLSLVAIPVGDGGDRRDELWRRTCFEAFVCANGSDAYAEFNFSPNGDWAAYQFSDYRTGQSDLDVAAPRIELTSTREHLSLTVVLDEAQFAFSAKKLRLGPTAIIEGNDGQLSYWALHHPSNKPDFHRSETFQLSLD